MNDQRTTLENEEQYQSWQEELARLENIDPDVEVDGEHISARIQALHADISAYEECHAFLKASGVTPEMSDAEYWNTLTTEYDEFRGWI